MKRTIRLKEWGVDIAATKQPSEKQLKNSTKSLIDKQYVLNTDKNGFIFDKSFKERGERNRDIVILGDSFVESLFVDEDKRLNAVIEHLDPSVRVLNGGYSGSTTLHLINVILNKVVPFFPDYVIFFIPTNDQRVQNIENGYWTKDERLSSLVSLEKEKYLIDNYRKNIHLNSVENVLSVVHKILEIYKIAHCFATTPHRSNVSEDDEWIVNSGIDFNVFCSKIEQRKIINQRCRNFCELESVDLIDLESKVAESKLFYDDLHLHNLSSPVVARILYNEMIRLGILVY